MTPPAHDASRGPRPDAAAGSAASDADQRHAPVRQVPAPTLPADPTALRDLTSMVPRRPRCSGCGELLLPAQCWVREADGWWFHYQCHALAGTTGRAQALGW